MSSYTANAILLTCNDNNNKGDEIDNYDRYEKDEPGTDMFLF